MEEWINLQCRDLIQAESRRPETNQHCHKVEQSIRAILQSVPLIENLPLKEAVRKLRAYADVQVPFHHRIGSEAHKWCVSFDQAQDVHVVQTLLPRLARPSSGRTNVVVAVNIPEYLLPDTGTKTSLERTLAQCQFYLACVAAGLVRHAPVGASLAYSQEDGDMLPVLLCISNTARHTQHEHLHQTREAWPAILKIIVRVPVDKAIASVNVSTGHKSSMSDKDAAYNLRLSEAVRATSLITAYDDMLQTSASAAPYLADASVLMALWLDKRGMHSTVAGGGFGTYEALIIIAMLLQQKASNGGQLLSPKYTAMQLFKATLMFLASRDLISAPFPAQESLPELADRDQPIFYHRANRHNILCKMTRYSYEKLQAEAKHSSSLLKRPSLSDFRMVFLQKAEPQLRYDVRFNVEVPREPIESAGWTRETNAAKRIFGILRKALGPRASAIHIDIAAPPTWPVVVAAEARTTTNVQVNVALNAEAMSNQFDLGPSPQNKSETTAFRHFWGEKADLRRFRDGRINESVSWPVDRDGEGAVRENLDFVLHRHCSEAVRIQWSQGIRMARQDENPPDVHATFEAFRRQLLQLRGLPLHVKRFALSTTCNPTMATPHNSIAQPFHHAVLHLEGSSRWPDHLEALQQTKTALLLKVRELLLQERITSNAQIFIGQFPSTNLHFVALDVALSDCIFRVQLYADNENLLLQRALQQISAPGNASRKVAQAIKHNEVVFEHRPIHVETIQSLALRFRSFSESVRLLKQWCSAHLLTPHLSEELLELLVAKIYTRPLGFTQPASPTSAFYQALALIAMWAWQTEPLLIDLHGTLTGSETDQMQTRFRAWRKLDPSMDKLAFFVGSKLDPSGSLWTEGRPCRVVAARFVALAEAALAKHVTDEGLQDVERIFTPALANFDFVLWLDPRRINQKDLALAINIPNCHASALEQFVTEVTILHEQSILLFHNAPCTVLAGLWLPEEKGRALRINSRCSVMPHASCSGGHAAEGPNRVVAVNRDAILQDILRLGGCLIRKISVRENAATA